LALLFLTLACNEHGSDRGALADLSDAQQSELRTTLEEANRNTDFDILLPGYVPEGLRWLPDIETHKKEADISYWREADAPAGSPQLLYVGIIERAGPGKTCPPCPGDDPSDVEQIDLVGTEAAITQARSSELGLSQTVLFNVANLHVRVTLDWEFSPGTTPDISDAMRQEALSVAESVIENSSQ
jgi:hypothetical protein